MTNRWRVLWLLPLVLLAAQVLPAQRGTITPPDQQQSDDTRLPNGKLQKDEILKAEYQKNLEDAQELMKLSESLKLELEKNERYVLSISAIKKTEDIEKLAKRLRARLKRP